MIIIQLRPVQQGNYHYYETYNITDECPVPVIGNDPKIIEGRVKRLYPNENLYFEICNDRR